MAHTLSRMGFCSHQSQSINGFWSIELTRKIKYTDFVHKCLCYKSILAPNHWFSRLILRVFWIWSRSLCSVKRIKAGTAGEYGEIILGRLEVGLYGGTYESSGRGHDSCHYRNPYLTLFVYVENDEAEHTRTWSNGQW